MSVMHHRTTFSLDQDTVERLRNLAKRWEISQSEVVRRALEMAEKQDQERIQRKLKALDTWSAQGGLAAEAAQGYLAELADLRQDWGRS